MRIVFTLEVETKETSSWGLSQTTVDLDRVKETVEALQDRAGKYVGEFAPVDCVRGKAAVEVS